MREQMQMQSAMRHGKAWQEKKRIRRRGGKTMSWSVSLVLWRHTLLLVVLCMAVVRKRKGDFRAFYDEWVVIGDGRLVAIDAW
jgi:hypothetical protein